MDFNQLKREKHPYSKHLGKYVRIGVQGENYLGKLAVADSDNVILNPFLFYECYFEKVGIYKKIKDELILSPGSIVSVMPVEEQYIDTLIQRSIEEVEKAKEKDKEKKDSQPA